MPSICSIYPRWGCLEIQWEFLFFCESSFQLLCNISLVSIKCSVRFRDNGKPLHERDVLMCHYFLTNFLFRWDLSIKLGLIVPLKNGMSLHNFMTLPHTHNQPYCEQMQRCSIIYRDICPYCNARAVAYICRCSVANRFHILFKPVNTQSFCLCWTGIFPRTQTRTTCHATSLYLTTVQSRYWTCNINTQMVRHCTSITFCHKVNSCVVVLCCGGVALLPLLYFMLMSVPLHKAGFLRWQMRPFYYTHCPCKQGYHLTTLELSMRVYALQWSSDIVETFVTRLYT